MLNLINSINTRPILCTSVIALFIKSGRIMRQEEQVQELVITDLLIIELYFYHFCMISSPLTDCFITRVCLISSCVSTCHFLHSYYLLKNSFYTPEASGSKYSSVLYTLHLITIILYIQDILIQ
jgi:hypothetical protein